MKHIFTGLIELAVLSGMVGTILLWGRILDIILH